MTAGEHGRTFLRLVAIVLAVAFFFVYQIVGNRNMDADASHFLVNSLSWDLSKIHISLHKLAW